MTQRTEQQDRAINEQAKILCVDAAAGSGKTSVLVERIIRLIEAKSATLDQIVAITFTEAAAAEMKMRLRRAFREKAPRDDPAEMSRWREMERWVETARVSTIHSFCAGLLRENALRIGLDPDFAVLAEAESVLLRDEVVIAALHELLEAGDAPAVRAATELGAQRLIAQLTRMLNRRRLIEITAREHPLHDPNALCAHWARLVQDENDLFFRSLSIDPEVRKSRERLNAFDGKCSDPDESREMLRRQMAEALDVVLTSDDPKTISAKFEEIAAVKFKPGSAKKWDSPETLDSLKEIQDEIRDYARKCIPDKIDEAVERRAAQLTCDIFGTYVNVQAAFDEAKDARGSLDFEDLIARTLAVLRDNKEVAGRVARGIKHLLIDEFQDTDSTQLEIAQLLSGHADGPDLFVVGDAKQSIYDFRGAEVEVFQQVKKTAGKVIPLGRNFRTLPDVMSFINDLFVRTEMLFAVEPCYAPLETSRAPLEKCRVEFLIPPLCDGNARDDYREQEAGMIAARIDEMVNAPVLGRAPALVWDDGAKQIRPARFGDIALLFRATPSIYIYEKSLRKLGIPYNVVAGEGFYERQECVDIKNLLALLVDPWDEMALLGFLRGPLCGLTDDSLVRLCMNGPLAPVFHSRDLPAPFPQAKDLARAHEVLDYLKSVSQRPLPEFMRRMLEDTGYEAIALSQFLGLQKAANVRKMLDLASDFARTSPPTLAGFVDYLNMVGMMEIREGDAVTQAGSAGAVVLMTIHKAKGLEFPIVFVPDISRDRKGPDNQDFEIHRRLGLAARTTNDYGETERPAIYRAIGRAQEMKSRAEHGRVFYVAMTRARDWLVLSGCPEPGANSWMASLESHYDLFAQADGSCCGPAVIRRTVPAAAKAQPPSAAPSVVVETLEHKAAPIQNLARTQRTFSVSELLECMTGAGDADESDREKSGGESRFVRGTVVHRMLELLGTCAVDELETLLRREFPGFMASNGAVDDLRGVAERFSKSATGARAASAQGVQREAAFVLKIDDAYVSGVIDMLLPDGTIVDYKTGRFHEDLFAQYEQQLRLYAIAARDVAGIQPRAAWLYYADSGAEIEVGVTPPVLEETIEKARQAVRMLKAGVGETT